MSMHIHTPQADDFLPLSETSEREAIDRPSMSYWKDVWRRVKSNTRALASLYIVSALLLFTVAGPWIWPVNPASQDLEQVSQAPNLGLQSLLIEDKPNVEVLLLAHSKVAASREPSLRILGVAHSEGVNLGWDPVTDARAYQLYRHELEPSGEKDLGLPLVTLPNTALSYLDRLGLETIRYHYSIVPLFAEPQPTVYASVEVKVQQAIKLSIAKRRGLGDGEELVAGGTVQLEMHPLGTDYLGRDMLARLMWGARTSLFIGIFAPLIYVSMGLMYGGLAGYLGGRTDNALMRFADFVIALPFLLFMILFKIAFGLGPGESGVAPMLVALVLLSWPATARLVRGQVLQLREEAYIAAARMMGASASYLVLRHMLPNLMGVLLVSLTFAIPTAIFIEAFLSFIGMGVVPPTPSWGSMCNDGIRTMLSHPHELIFPALFISITVLAFNLLGDGLRDAMDSRLRGEQ
jgi:oligopeptide transport system permease protein